MSAYHQLEDRFRRLTLLGDLDGVLQWDSAAVMPQGGAEARGEQAALVQTLIHEHLTDPALPELLDRAAGESLDSWQAANLAHMRRAWTHAAGVPKDLVAARARAVSTGEMVWRGAREAADFPRVRPHLEEILRLTREIALARAERLGVTAYDALLDGYDPGASAAAIDGVFAGLEAFLPGFIAQVIERQSRETVREPQGPFPADRQRALALRLMKRVGFDFAHGRLDVSLHPFCGGTPEDVRITTRYDESDFASGMMAVLHETGHGLYERNLPRAWRYQPVGRVQSMALHESQSLLLEMQACRSPAFLAFAAPLAAEVFGGSGPAWSADNLRRLQTRVKRSFIRVDADEVTYPAHVILRYRLERAMIAGDLAVADLPGAWNEGFAALLGATPPSDREGCLQDIHWYAGAIGYFPTYTLGAIAAAQFFDAARKALPGLGTALGQGDFAPLLGWLKERVHSQGARLSTDGLLREVTGRPLDAAVFLAHLRQRYLGG